MSVLDPQILDYFSYIRILLSLFFFYHALGSFVEAQVFKQKISKLYHHFTYAHLIP